MEEKSIRRFVILHKEMSKIRLQSRLFLVKFALFLCNLTNNFSVKTDYDKITIFSILDSNEYLGKEDTHAKKTISGRVTSQTGTNS